MDIIQLYDLYFIMTASGVFYHHATSSAISWGLLIEMKGRIVPHAKMKIYQYSACENEINANDNCYKKFLNEHEIKIIGSFEISK